SIRTSTSRCFIRRIFKTSCSSTACGWPRHDGVLCCGGAVTTTPPGIERVLFTEEQVSARIEEVAAEITAKFRGRDLKLMGVLKGSVFFLTALARALIYQVAGCRAY